MKKLILLFVLFTTLLFPQLKELEVKPCENRGGIPIFRDYPDKAAVFFYSSFDNLKITSSYGIDKLYDRGGGNYIVVISPEKQRLEVQCAGYKTEIIHIKEMQARDCLFYSVEPRKQNGDFSNVTELAISVQTIPSEARITIDGKDVRQNTPTVFSTGTHQLRVEKYGYADYTEEIMVSPSNTLFKINLLTNDPVGLTISSNPTDAEVYLDGQLKGKTKKAMFIYPGIYELKLILLGYISITEKITVTKDEKKNIFNYNFVKNLGKLKIEVTPPNATVKVNREKIDPLVDQELSPGTYQIEVEALNFDAYKTTVVIELGKTKVERINLTQRIGKLQFSVSPPEAECSLSQNGIEKYRWEGLKLMQAISIGSYDLTVRTTGYKTISKKIVINENQTTIEDIQMEKGLDAPAGMVLVEGGSFDMGSNDGEADEKPVRRVTVSTFLIGKNEVTVKEYKAFATATRRSMPSAPDWGWKDNEPISRVSWKDANEYCNWAGGRLLSEAEWEFAAKGGLLSKGFTYSGSNNLDEVAWHWGNSAKKLHPVGTKKPNELGIYDMSGNVGEWCSDWKENYPAEDETDPLGPVNGTQRIQRGGTYEDDVKQLFRVTNRTRYVPVYGGDFGGFRLAKDLSLDAPDEQEQEKPIKNDKAEKNKSEK